MVSAGVAVDVAGIPDEEVTDGVAVDNAEVVMAEDVVAGETAMVAGASLSATAMSFFVINGEASTDKGEAASESPKAAPATNVEETTQSELLFLLILGEDDCSFRVCAMEAGNEVRAP